MVTVHHATTATDDDEQRDEEEHAEHNPLHRAVQRLATARFLQHNEPVFLSTKNLTCVQSRRPRSGRGRCRR